MRGFSPPLEGAETTPQSFKGKPQGRALPAPVPFRERKNDSEEDGRSHSLARWSCRARLCLVQAFASEFLALLAVQALGVGLLGAFDRGGAARLLGLLGLGGRGGCGGGLREGRRC